MIQASDKSRDYTISDPSLAAAQQVPGVPAAPTVWPNAHSAPVYPGSGYATGAAMQPPVTPGQVPSWDPSGQAGRTPFVSGPASYAGQYAGPGGPAYATAATPVGSSPLSVSGAPATPSMSMSQPGFQPPVRPGGVPPAGQPPYSM